MVEDADRHGEEKAIPPYYSVGFDNMVLALVDHPQRTRRTNAITATKYSVHFGRRFWLE